MVTGIETAGLVLATLPIAIEAVKAYVGGVKTIKDVLLPQYRDEKLEDFYADLWIEMHLFSQQIRVIIDAVPGLTDQHKSELEKNLHAHDIGVRNQAAQSFKAYFQSDDDYNVCVQLLDKISRLLCRLVENKYYNVRPSEMSSDQLLKKLRAFVQSRESKTTTSTLRERLDLRMKEKDLRVRVANIENWNKRLRILIQQNERLQNKTKTATTTQVIKKYHSTRPSVGLSRMPHILHQALITCASCTCPERHCAMFSLSMPQDIHQVEDPLELKFNLFLSLPMDTSLPSWQESQVYVRRQIDDQAGTSDVDVDVDFSERQQLAHLCPEIRSVHGTGHCLSLLAEGNNRQTNVWRLRSVRRQLQLLDPVETASLATRLNDFTGFSLPKKRELALMLAYALVLLDGSPWLQDRWTKNHISFLKNEAIAEGDNFDLTQPFVSCYIQNITQAEKAVNLDVLHPCLSILSLGILLIEIETGQPIEYFRRPEDLSNGVENENTDFTVADRVAKSLVSCTPDYQEAIFACLDIPWRSAGRKVTLQDPETRKAVYDTIINRLENEVECLSINNMAS